MRATQRLIARGFEAYLVGGCVRDLLLDRTPKDYDIATEARPPQVKRTFPRNCRIIGRRFKLAHLHFHNNTKILECSTFRRTPQIDSENDLLITRDNEFGNAEEDALRRDFTVNALFLDPTRDCILDYANGLPDLRDRVIRTIGDPRVRFREDPVRILRAAKFAGRLGFSIEAETFSAMCETSCDLMRAAPPRLFEEILRLLRGGHALESFQLLRDVGALKSLLPVLADFLGRARHDQRVTFWRLLEAVDQRVLDGHVPNSAVLLGALLVCPVLAEAEANPDRSPSSIAEQLLGPLSLTLRLPRRDAGCLKRICGVQHRFLQLDSTKRFRVGGFVHGPYFEEALELFELRMHAFGDTTDTGDRDVLGLIQSWRDIAFGDGERPRHTDDRHTDDRHTGDRHTDDRQTDDRQTGDQHPDELTPDEPTPGDRAPRDRTSVDDGDGADLANVEPRAPHDAESEGADGQPNIEHGDEDAEGDEQPGDGARRRRRRRRGGRRRRRGGPGEEGSGAGGEQPFDDAQATGERPLEGPSDEGLEAGVRAARPFPVAEDDDEDLAADHHDRDAGEGQGDEDGALATDEAGEGAEGAPGEPGRRRRRRKRRRGRNRGEGGQEQEFPASAEPTPHGEATQPRREQKPPPQPAPVARQLPRQGRRDGRDGRDARDGRDGRNERGGKQRGRRDRDRGGNQPTPRDVDVVPRYRDRRGKVDVIEPAALDLSAFDVELDPKRVPTFGSIVEGKGRPKRRSPRVPEDGVDDYRPPPPPGSDQGPGAPPPAPPRDDPDTFGDW